MPYQTIQDLPEALRTHLPVSAQEIFRRAYNGAWDSYVEGGGSRPANRSRQDVAHKAAWLEVRRKFLSKDGHLARRSSGQQSALT